MTKKQILFSIGLLVISLQTLFAVTNITPNIYVGPGVTRQIKVGDVLVDANGIPYSTGSGGISTQQLNVATNTIWVATTNLVTGTSNSLVSTINSATNGLWIQTTNIASLTAAPMSVDLIITNTTPTNWVYDWSDISTLARVTFPSTGTVTWTINWPIYRKATLWFAFENPLDANHILPTGCIYLVNGVYTNTAPSFGKTNYVTILHDRVTYQFMSTSNNIGWGIP